jgi:hypothetical protein
MFETPFKFVKVEGTEVTVHVTSAAEGRAALKELKHKKRELNHTKRTLGRELEAARKRQNRKPRPPDSLWFKIFDAEKGPVAFVLRVARAFRTPKPKTGADPEAIARELKKTSEILHHVDSCILQIEGKLLVDK